MLTTESELQTAYGGSSVATNYVAARFCGELNRLLHDRQVNAVNRLIHQGRPRRVLEIAPGPGRITRDLSPVEHLVCLEFNCGMIEQGRAATALHRRASWVRGNGFQLPFANNFDLVVCFRFIRHFHDADRRRLYAEIRRVLNPHGLLIMDGVNERTSRTLRSNRPAEYPVYDKLYDAMELHSELGAAGLEVLERDPVQKFYRLQYLSQVMLGPRANWANRWAIRGLEWLPGRDGLEWIVTCRRA